MSLQIFVPKEKFEELSNLLKHEISKMNGLDSCSFIAPTTVISSTAFLILSYLRPNKEPVNNLTGSDLISHLKIINIPKRFEDHPLYFTFHCDTSDPMSRKVCTFFSRDEKSDRQHQSPSILMIPFISTLFLSIDKFPQKAPRPPVLIIDKFHLRRCVPNFLYLPISWITFIIYFFSIKIPMSCCRATGRFLSKWVGRPLLWFLKCIFFPCIYCFYCCKSRLSSKNGIRDEGIIPTDDIEQTHSNNNNEPSNNNSSNGRDSGNRSTQKRARRRNNSNEQSDEPPNEPKERKTKFKDPIVPDSSSSSVNPPNDVFEDTINSLKPTQIPTSREKIIEENQTMETDEFRKFKEEMNNSINPTLEDLKTDERIAELNKKNEEQKKEMDSWRVEDETESIEEREEIRLEKERFQKEMEEQNRRHEEKLNEMRRQREEKQKKADEEYYEMRLNFERNVQMMLVCCQMTLRFRDKEQEWSDILKRIREPLTRVVNSYYNVQNEYRFSQDSENDGSDIVCEAKLFAKLVKTAQDNLAQYYDKLESLSEQYEDRIFLKMIMQSVSVEGFRCDSIGYKILDLIRCPSSEVFQKELNSLVSSLDSYSIPTTSSLKTKSVTARMEDYSNIQIAPSPDWYSQI